MIQCIVHPDETRENGARSRQKLTCAYCNEKESKILKRPSSMALNEEKESEKDGKRRRKKEMQKKRMCIQTLFNT